MPILVIKGKITKGYGHWVKVHDDAEELRIQNMELEDPTTIHIVIYTPSMEALQKHMENDLNYLRKLVEILVLRLVWLPFAAIKKVCEVQL